MTLTGNGSAPSPSNSVYRGLGPLEMLLRPVSSSTAAKSQAQIERARCPRDGMLLDRNNKCWNCGKTPEEWEGSMAVIPMSEAKAKVELTSQPTLDDLLFERYQVDTVKVTVSGTIEMPIAALRELGADLEPGDRVVFSCIGHVADMSSPYNLKDNNHRGRVVLKAEVLNGVHDVGRD